MKFSNYFLLGLLILPKLMVAQKTYKISDIPDSLTKNANVVYFINEGHLEIKADNQAIYKVHSVAGILNSKGKSHATKSEFYDKLSRVNTFKGNVYNEDGSLIERLKNADIVDQSATSGGTIFDDNRVQFADLKQNEYPYIVEFETEVEYKYTYSIPNWSVLPNQNISIISSKFQISSPGEFLPRIKIANSKKEFTRISSQDNIHLKIEFDNLIAQEREPYGPSFNELRPIIHCSPSKFEYEGYNGDMSSWNSYGQWVRDLNKGRSSLPQSTIDEIKKIASAFESREDKIHAVYQYVQDKTRYVSIQLGIGGLQPFPATTVDELGYGDCKALSNYTYALLEAINIPSNYAFVYGGSNPPKLDPEFPAHNFNHAILCVPNKQDSIWLECTSQTNPFGYVGDFTGDRDVLLITKNGGKIVHTPIYKKHQNTQTTVATVDVSKDGSAMANISIDYRGLQYENGRVNEYVHKGNEELKKWIYSNTDIGDFSVQEFNFKETKEKIPSIRETLNLEIPRLAKPNGKRMFLSPNLLNKYSSIPPKEENRKTDIVLKFTGIDIDSIIYNIPEHLYPEYIQEPISIESEFGSYQSSATISQGQLIYIRKMEYNKGRYSKESYNDFRNFYKQVNKADKLKVVLLDKN